MKTVIKLYNVFGNPARLFCFNKKWKANTDLEESEYRNYRNKLA